jgi:hypothetical protein
VTGSWTATYDLDMSSRLEKNWRVLASPSTSSVDRCVDIFVRPDGRFGFEEFRRDPEDMGTWTPVAYYSAQEFDSEQDAVTGVDRRDTPGSVSGRPFHR